MKEESYQQQAVADLAANYSPDHFRFAIRQCRDVIARVIAEDNRSDQQIARVHILRYLDLQLSRAVRWVEDEADLLALVLRSQIELRCWAEYVSKGPAEAAAFLHEANIDLRELYEKVEKASPGAIEAPPEPIRGDRVRLTLLNAKERALWTFCSKLIHPSSLLLIDLDAWIFNSSHREKLAQHVLDYGWWIIEIFHDIVWAS